MQYATRTPAFNVMPGGFGGGRRLYLGEPSATSPTRLGRENERFPKP